MSNGPPGRAPAPPASTSGPPAAPSPESPEPPESPESPADPSAGSSALSLSGGTPSSAGSAATAPASDASSTPPPPQPAAVTSTTADARAHRVLSRDARAMAISPSRTAWVARFSRRPPRSSALGPVRAHPRRADVAAQRGDLPRSGESAGPGPARMPSDRQSVRMPLTAPGLPDLPPELAGPVGVALAKPVRSIPRPHALPGGCRYEPKWDGYRLVIVRGARSTRLWSKQGRDLTDRFQDVATAAIAQLPAGTVVDGEVVVWNGDRLDRKSTRLNSSHL